MILGNFLDPDDFRLIVIMSTSVLHLAPPVPGTWILILLAVDFYVGAHLVVKSFQISIPVPMLPERSP